jgi:hypothetical protein
MIKRGMDKKGFELAINTVIAMILAIVLLAFLVVFFTMGSQNFLDTVKGFFSHSNVDSVVNSCNIFASSNFQYKFCCEKQKVKYYDNEKKAEGEFTCNQLINRSFVSGELGTIDCSGVSC